MSKFKVGDLVIMIGGDGPSDVLVATLDRLIPYSEPYVGEWRATCINGDPAVFREDQIALIERPPRPDPTALTRRDHFAMAALTGVMGSGDLSLKTMLTDEESRRRVSDFSYKIADAMEAARNKEGAE